MLGRGDGVREKIPAGLVAGRYDYLYIMCVSTICSIIAAVDKICGGGL